METMERLFGADAPKAEEVPVEVTEPVLPAAPAAPEVAAPPVEGGDAAPPVAGAEPSPEPSVPDPSKQPVTQDMLGAVLGERERRQNAERERDNLRKQIERFEAKERERETAPKVPDPMMEPDAYAAFQQQQAQQSEWNVVRRISSVMAAQAHGEELVKKAVEWWDQKVASNPALGNEIVRQAHPYDYAVQQYKRDQDLQRLEGKTLDDWFAAEVARRGLAAGGVAPVAAPVPPVPPPVMPPRSMASVPNAMLPGPVAYERTKAMTRLMGDG